MIRFHKIRFKNILSFGDTFVEIELDKSPCTLIQGKNGSGKSTFLDALCFGLFGKPYRKINKPQLINQRNRKDLLVEIEFDDENSSFLIRRGISPNVFEIIKDGKIINQESSSRDYQEYLEKYILKFDYQSFTQLVILGKAMYVSFFKLNSSERRRFVETMLGLNIFSVMNDVHKENVSSLREEFRQIETKIQVLKEKIVLRRKYIEDLKNSERERASKHFKSLESEIEQIEKEKKELEKRRSEIKIEEVDQTKFRAIEKKKEKLLEFKHKFDAKIQSIDSNISFFIKNDGICPTCYQQIPFDIKHKRIESFNEKKKDFENVLNSILNDINVVNEKLNYFTKIIKQNMLNEHELCNINKQLQILENRLNTLNVQKQNKISDFVEKISNETNNLNELISEYNKTLNEKENLIKTLEKYDIVSTMLKDSGIKASIVRKYLPLINNAINEYLRKLSFFARIEIDENFDEHIYHRGIDELSYMNFSEGEKLRIDLAVLMAWKSVIRLKTRTNLFIFDEILDASIDQNGIESFIELIYQLQDTNVFIISHSEKWVDRFDHNLIFFKENGFSKLLSNPGG